MLSREAAPICSGFPTTFHLATTKARSMLPRMKVRSPLLSLALALIASASSQAQVLWVGATDGLLNSLTNWTGGTPAGSDLIFTSTLQPLISVDASIGVNSLTFNQVYPAYTFSTANGSFFRIGAGGINVAAQLDSPVDFAASLPVELLNTQTWAVDGMLRVAGPISSAPNTTTTLTKTGSGTLVLGGNSTFSGGLVVQAGTLLITSGSIGTEGNITAGSLGIGPLTLETNSTFGAARPNLIIANPISLASGVILASGSNNERESGLALAGPVTAATDTMLVSLSGNNPLAFAGALDGPANTAFTFRSTSAGDLDGAAFAGTTSPNVTSLTADRAALYFVTPQALPSTVTVQAINNGYVGVVATDSYVPLAASVLVSRITDPSAFAGTFGFDTQPDSRPPHVYNEDLDFRAFTHPSFRIGSATEAVLTGNITAPIGVGATAFRFGSGGGHLFVQGNLSDTIDPSTLASIPTAVTVSSPLGEDLSGIILSGQNTFSGTVTVGTITSHLRVDRAMVILNSPGALPAGATFSLGDVSYVGYTEAAGFLSFADFLARLRPGGYEPNSVFGLDSAAVLQEEMTRGNNESSKATRVVSEAVDLRSLTAGFLGTITNVRIDGEVRAPSTGVLQLTGTAEGRLTIASGLHPTASDSSPNIDRLVIGYPSGNNADDFSQSEVELTGANTYTGGTTLQGGTLVVSNNSTVTQGSLISGPLGTGQLAVMTADDPVVLASNSASGATVYNAVALSGRLQLGRGGQTDNQSQPSAIDPNPINLAGDISGAGGIDAYGRTILTGTNSYTGGTNSRQGTLIFGSTLSVPASGPLVSSIDGYIGVASAPTSIQSDFIDRFDAQATQGTIGFDSLTTTPTVFSDAISLSRFTGMNPRLGSATSAILTGPITPAGATYRFGGGGGYLEVTSALTGSNGAVEVSSPHGQSLTLRIAGTTTYGGNTTAQNSAIIFAAGSLPGSSPFVMDSNGYIGTEDPAFDTNFDSFLSHFASNLDRGTIGFDTNPSETTGRIINTPLDLRRFTGTLPYIGTSTALTFGANSSFTLADTASAYRFAGYKGGRLQIDTVLSGAKGLVIGDPDSLMTQVSPTGITSSVVLNAANTFTNGTTLYAGNLYLGTSTVGDPILSGPIGTGTLTVEPVRFSHDTRPVLRALSSPVTLANAIVLNSDLGVGSELTLSGSISGAGGIYKVDAGNLTLSGNNSGWFAGIFVSDGSVTFTQDTSAGNGMLKLGELIASTATFTSSAPSIRALAGENSGNQLILAANSVLNIAQDGSSRYLGQISGDGAALNIQGFGATVANQLTLGGTNLHTGGTTIGSNVELVVAHDQALGTTGGVTLNQGSLAVAQGVTATFNAATHPLLINGGRLSGNGTLAFDTPLTVNGGANGPIVLAPGARQPGKLSFNFTQGATLILDSGGNYHWRLMDATDASAGWDTIVVSGGVNIAATLAPFDLTISTVNSDGSSGQAANFDVYSSYSWTLVTADSLITGFNSSKFNIDTSMFLRTATDGTFSVGLDGAGTSLMLNYTAAAIPEPSTWAMMVIGVAIIAISTLRRRRS